MTAIELGRLEEVPLREVFEDEARDFTPWLAAHLEELASALNLDPDTKLVESEGAVGSFSVDVIAKAGNGFIVIENQLDRTDHSHLGQLLTYAAGRDARTLIWITPEFREEHRAALDWLNQWTGEEIEVYGVEVRAVRIGDSLPAPEFRPVSLPNNWSRRSRAAQVQGGKSPWTRDDYREFYQPVVESLREKGLTENVRPTGNYSERFDSGSGIDKVEYRVSLVTPMSGHSANVYLYFGSDNADMNLSTFAALEELRAEIEMELGVSLVWQPSRGYRTAISVTQPISLFEPPSRHSDIQAWMIEMLPRLKDVFDPRLRNIAMSLDAKKEATVDGGLGGEVFE